MAIYEDNPHEGENHIIVGAYLDVTRSQWKRSSPSFCSAPGGGRMRKIPLSSVVVFGVLL
jgi:hypothetical protein